MGNTTAQRQIVNMAAGDISTTSTDAINGSQLYAISKSVADNLGGGLPSMRKASLLPKLQAEKWYFRHCWRRLNGPGQ